MAACVLCKEINELFLESLVELLFGRTSRAPAARNLPNGGDTSRVARSPIVSTACAYGLRLLYLLLLKVLPASQYCLFGVFKYIFHV